jgi:hypothetical protein
MPLLPHHFLDGWHSISSRSWRCGFGLLVAGHIFVSLSGHLLWRRWRSVGFHRARIAVATLFVVFCSDIHSLFLEFETYTQLSSVRSLRQRILRCLRCARRLMSLRRSMGHTVLSKLFSSVSRSAMLAIESQPDISTLEEGT